MFGFVAASRRETPTIVLAQNPMALRPMTDGRRWEGQTGVVEARGSGYFTSFSSMAYGVRAGAITLRTYMNTHGKRTISTILARWAPAEDGNDTAAYIRSVSANTGFTPDQPLEWDFETIRKLTTAIIRHECGYAAVSADVIAQGLGMAGLEASAEPMKDLARQSAEIRNGAGGVAVGAGGFLATLIAYKDDLLSLLQGAGSATSALSRSACSPAEWASIFSFLILSLLTAWFGWRVISLRLRARKEGLR